MTGAPPYPPRAEAMRRPPSPAAPAVTPPAAGGTADGGDQVRLSILPITADAQPSPWGFVGRDQELTALLALLDPRPEAPAGVPVSVVTGMAGVGKTALAWQAARTAVGRGWFPGGAVLVDLYGCAQVAPEQVYASLLHALDPDLPASVEEPASAYRQLMSHLERLSRPVLLVVDNADNTDQIRALLPTGRAHRVVITSRDTLEELPGGRLLTVDVLPPDLAVELLGSRRPGDPRLGANPAAAAELARLCGYLPSALHIVAVLMADDPSRPPTDLVKELAAETARLKSASGELWAGRAAVELVNRRVDDTPARLFRLLPTVPGPDVAAEAETAQRSTPPRAPKHGRADSAGRRQRKSRLLRTAGAAMVIAIAVTVFACVGSFNVDAGTGGARIVLSTSQAKMGDTYLATASGFSPGEAVRFSWTGPSDGVMGVFPADSKGGESLGPVFERHPPGNYTITGTGLTSGRIASAVLQVVTGTGAARLMLSTSEVKIGDTYFATVWGFAPGEDLRFSVDRANDVMGVFPAGSGGSGWHRVLEKGPPGTHTITVTGLTSGRTASAELKVARS
ncbi:MAG: ATP-binding protein [Actinomycetota bacterium]|nr:ATP-binding protein [Actinomycetota bacterium]